MLQLLPEDLRDLLKVQRVVDLRVVVLLRRYDDTTIRRAQVARGARSTRRRTKTRKIDFWSLLGGFSPGDPENRIRGAILRILVVGELRGMTFKLFFRFLRKRLRPQ